MSLLNIVSAMHEAFPGGIDFWDAILLQQNLVGLLAVFYIKKLIKPKQKNGY